MVMGFYKNFIRLHEFTKKSKWSCDGQTKVFNKYNKLSFPSDESNKLTFDEWIIQAAIAYKLHENGVPFISNKHFYKIDVFGDVVGNETIKILRLDKMEAIQNRPSEIFKTINYEKYKEIQDFMEMLYEYADGIVKNSQKPPKGSMKGL